ncbi:MAG: hypothetical protein A2138_10885 [Deltaproteobacteria bacterium RBG_16_71_12]|nr:MAG: hypothetical protein A2138_10885 [Deltaproteobacteria bacterium RBG_16_71_12]
MWSAGALAQGAPAKSVDAGVLPSGEAPADGAADAEPRDAAILSEGPTEPPPKLPGIPFYEDLMRKDPDDPEAHQTLAAAFARAGKIDDARREARRAIELDAKRAEAHQALGLIEEGAGNVAAATELYRTATTLDGNVEYRLDLARSLFLESKLPDAQATWEKIAVDFEGNLEVQFALADAFRELGRFEEAQAAYTVALNLAPEGSERRIDILLEQGRLIADRGQPNEALGLLTRARAEAPKDADVHYNLGVLYVRLAEHEAAVTSFKEAIRLKPDLAKAHNNMGVAFDKAGKHEEALAAFQKATAVDPRFADALYNVGLVSFKMRKFKEARAAFEKALQVAPEMADAKFYLGEVYYQLGDSTKALRVYKEALRSNPEDASSHRRLGDIYLEQGDLSLAVGEYWAAVDADEHDVPNRAQLMRVLLVRNEEGDVRRAVKLGEKGLELDPSALEVRVALAEAEVQQGRSPRARQILDEGVAASPKDPRIHLALGQHHLQQGNAPAAREAFDAALALDPKNPSALAAAGEVAYALGDKEGAKKRIREALALDAGQAAARADLGRMLLEDGKNADALKELKRAAEDQPKLGKAWFYLAFAQNNTGAGAAAVEKSLRKAIESSPDLAEAHYQLGALYLKQAKKDAGCKALKRAVELRAGYETALVEIERNCATP